MRFLADENVSRLVVERLRNGGHDVVFIRETKPGATDADVLRAADDEVRILITEDRDFGEMIIRQRLGAHGMMLLELDRLSNTMEAAAVAEAVSAHADRAGRESRRDRTWTNSGPPAAPVTTSTAAGAPAYRPTASCRRSSNTRTIPGSSACSSTPS